MLFNKKQSSKFQLNKETKFDEPKENVDVEINPKTIETVKNISEQRVQIDKEEANNMLDEVLQHFINNKPKSLMNVQRGVESKESLLNEVERFLKGKRVREELVEDVKERFDKYIWGYHILEDLINDPEISDIKIIGEKNIRIKRLGKRMTSNVKFSST